MHVCIYVCIYVCMHVCKYVSRQMDTLIARQSYTHTALATKIVVLTIGNVELIEKTQTWNRRIEGSERG